MKLCAREGAVRKGKQVPQPLMCYICVTILTLPVLSSHRVAQLGEKNRLPRGLLVKKTS